jgi:hypothetical protein
MLGWMKRVSIRTHADKKKATGRVAFSDVRAQKLVAVAAGPFPGDQVANGCASGGRRRRVLIGLDFLPRGFFTDRPDAQADFFLFLINLDDLEVELASWFEMHRLSIGINGFRVVTQPFNALGNLNKCAEVRHAQNPAMHNVAYAVLRKE